MCAGSIRGELPENGSAGMQASTGKEMVSKDYIVMTLQILAKAGVSKSVLGNKVYNGNPIQESRAFLKQLANIKKIPEILNKLK